MQSKVESTAVKIFVSYAPKDEGYKQHLLKHLSPLVRQGSITSWDAQQIRAGSEQHEEALKHFYEADIILCLLSSDFIYSSSSFPNLALGSFLYVTRTTKTY